VSVCELGYFEAPKLKVKVRLVVNVWGVSSSYEHTFYRYIKMVLINVYMICIKNRKSNNNNKPVDI